MCTEISLINRIVGAIKLTQVFERKRCTLVMAPEAYEELDEYLYSKMTEGHPSELWEPGNLKKYRGMPIEIDEECKQDFYIQYRKSNG